MTDVFHCTHCSWESMLIYARVPVRRRPHAMWFQHVTYCKCLRAALRADANPPEARLRPDQSPHDRKLSTRAHMLSAVWMQSCWATHTQRGLPRPRLCTHDETESATTFILLHFGLWTSQAVLKAVFRVALLLPLDLSKWLKFVQLFAPSSNSILANRPKWLLLLLLLLRGRWKWHPL